MLQGSDTGRRRAWVCVIAVAGLLVALAAASPPTTARAAAGGTCNGQPAPWMNPKLSPDQRASLLVPQMTLAQEAQETASVSTATESREVPTIPSLCIPALLLTNGSAGISTNAPVQSPATALPAPISLAATWDPADARQYGVVEGNEALDQGRNDVEGPDINIARVPENGRTFEAYGEDPYLDGQIAAGNIEGIQSRGVIATPKHFDANNQETNRATINELISERTLQEIYMPAFHAAVQAGAGSVMCALNQVNNAYSCDSPDLLNVLDNDWHFPGFVVSDFSAIHSTVQAADAGTDLELPSATYFGPALLTAVQDGQVSKATLDQMVQRILRSMFALGLFDRPAPATTPIPAAADGAVSRSLAEDGTVLLKNSRNTLPLDLAGTKSIALIGPEAGTASAGGDGSAKVAPLYTVSPLQAITAEAAAHHVSVSYAGAPPVNMGPDAIPANFLTPPGGTSGGQQGLLAQYFNNSDWSGTPVVSQVQPYIDQNALPPAGVDSAKTYSVRWTGTVTPTTSGTYTLSLTTYGKGTLYFNGAELLSDGGSFPAQTVSKTVTLTAGTAYPIRVDYANSNMGLAELSWQPPADADNPLIDSAVQAAKAAQTAVVFVGDETSEGVDRPDLSLPGFQDQLVEAVAAANPHTIVVLNTGDPVLMPWLSQVAAVVEAWYPGEEDGNAIAPVLFGQVDPSGKLPITFPASDSAVPASTPAQYPGVNGVATYSEGLEVGYRWDDAQGVTPLFPFGFGLSYTQFAFSHLTVSRGGGNGPVQVSAEVTNTGGRSGTEVAQLYIGDPAAIGEPPRQLKAFERVTAQPGQHATVHFTLPQSSLAYWDTTTNAWAVAPGAYQVYVGDSSALANLPLRGTFQLTG